MRKNRTELQLIIDFLSCIDDGVDQVSTIMRKVNIPYSKLEELSLYLIERNMISKVDNGGSTRFRIEKKGQEFLMEYKSFQKIMENIYGIKL